jgi:hypothetical protein
MTSTTVDSLWTIEDVSAYLRVPVDTLYQWRHRRTGRRPTPAKPASRSSNGRSMPRPSICLPDRCGPGCPDAASQLPNNLQ